MRELKFRVYHKESKEMLYSSPADIFIWQHEKQPIEIMQYTGLKDKNGKEIYEGDLTNYGTVEWCECLNWDSGGSNHPGFYFGDKYEYKRGSLSYHDGFDENIEVFGNIYEGVKCQESKR